MTTLPVLVMMSDNITRASYDALLFISPTVLPEFERAVITKLLS